MGNCVKCGKKVGFLGDVCVGCYNIGKTVREQHERHSAECNNRVESVIITTAPTLANYRISKTIDIVTSECVYGINVFRDFFASMSDIFGGRSETSQRYLREARINCLNELKKEAATLGANAVIAVDLDYSEFSGGGKSMLFLVASGTAVIVEKIDDNYEGK